MSRLIALVLAVSACTSDHETSSDPPLCEALVVAKTADGSASIAKVDLVGACALSNFGPCLPGASQDGGQACSEVWIEVAVGTCEVALESTTAVTVNRTIVGVAIGPPTSCRHYKNGMPDVVPVARAEPPSLVIVFSNLDGST